MAESDKAVSSPALVSGRFIRVAVWCAYASGVVCILGILFLVAFYVTFTGWLGNLNDIAVSIQYAFMIPIAFALHRLLRHQNPGLSLTALRLGVAGMLAVIVLQLLLVIGILSFGVQIGIVLIGFMVVLAWFVIIGRLGRSIGILPKSMALHVLAGLYFGYPFWAFSAARRLRAHSPD